MQKTSQLQVAASGATCEPLTPLCVQAVSATLGLRDDPQYLPLLHLLFLCDLLEFVLMRTHPAHDGEASGRAVCADAGVVRLRLSAGQRVLAVLRWMFGLAATVVVMWFGAAFLASPASAAPAVPA